MINTFKAPFMISILQRIKITLALFCIIIIKRKIQSLFMVRTGLECFLIHPKFSHTSNPISIQRLCVPPLEKKKNALGQFFNFSEENQIYQLLVLFSMYMALLENPIFSHNTVTRTDCTPTKI